MKDFFTQCMKDLYALTGIEQVRWMQNDLVNGKRDFDICVEAMVQVCKQFPYIEEGDQMTIVKRMMVEDKNYKSLNSRTVWGWLDMHKDAHYRGQTHYQETEVHEVAPPEVADKYAAMLLANISKIGAPKPLTEIHDPLVALLKEQIGTEIRPEMKKLRGEYVRENYDLDGVKKDCWTSFDEWLELKYPSIAP